MGKKQIFDIVFVFNEYNLLEERFKLLGNYVDKFIVYDFGTGCRNFSSENIIHIKSPGFFLDPDFELAQQIVRLLDPKKLYVEDVFMFSKANELPDMEVFINNLHLLNIKPIVCNQKKVFWFSDMISRKKHFGTFALKFSDVLRMPKIYNHMFELVHPVFVNYETIECGWQLNGFQSIDDFQHSVNFWKKLNDEHVECYKSFLELKDFNNELLLKHNPNLPELFSEHQQEKIVREPKTILLTIDEEVFSQSNELALLVSKGKIISNNNFEHTFQIPSINYYAVDDFEISYSKNETLQALNKLGTFEDDIITYTKKETLDEVSVTYQEFSKVIPCEVF